MKKILLTLTSILSLFFAISAQAQETTHSDLFPPTETTNTTSEILSITDETPTTTTNTNHDLPPLPPPPKENISATFTTSPIVNWGAYQWTMELTTDTSDEMLLDTDRVQIWNAFKITDYTKFGSKLIITIEPTEPPLSVECSIYTLTIPKKALETVIGENKNSITGNFQVLGCPPPPETEENEGNEQDGVNSHDGSNSDPKMSTGSTLKEGNLYLSLMDTDENGKQYVNISNLVYLLGVISFFLILFFVLFGFIKNSFLGRSKKY